MIPANRNFLSPMDELKEEVNSLRAELKSPDEQLIRTFLLLRKNSELLFAIGLRNIAEMNLNMIQLANERVSEELLRKLKEEAAIQTMSLNNAANELQTSVFRYKEEYEKLCATYSNVILELSRDDSFNEGQVNAVSTGHVSDSNEIIDVTPPIETIDLVDTSSEDDCDEPAASNQQSEQNKHYDGGQYAEAETMPTLTKRKVISKKKLNQKKKNAHPLPPDHTRSKQNAFLWTFRCPHCKGGMPGTHRSVNRHFRRIHPETDSNYDSLLKIRAYWKKRKMTKIKKRQINDQN